MRWLDAPLWINTNDLTCRYTGLKGVIILTHGVFRPTAFGVITVFTN